MGETQIKVPENFAVDEAIIIRQKINILMENKVKDFVIDFTDCNFIDSTGLGVLVTIYKKCIEINGSLKMKGMNERIRKVFRLTRLDGVFDIT